MTKARMHLALMLTLTFSTGIVDAVGYLGYDKVFTGMQAAAARKIGVADVTTVVVTSTMVGLASESRLAGGSGDKWPRRLLAVLGILIGALVGALTLQVNLWLGVLLTAVIIGAVTIVGHHSRHLG